MFEAKAFDSAMEVALGILFSLWLDFRRILVNGAPVCLDSSVCQTCQAVPPLSSDSMHEPKETYIGCVMSIKNTQICWDQCIMRIAPYLYGNYYGHKVPTCINLGLDEQSAPIIVRTILELPAKKPNFSSFQ